VLGQVTLLLLAPFVLLGLVALLVNQPYYRFPASIISINHFTRATPAQRTGRFNFDLLFYVRYLLDFEWPLLVPALLLFPYVYRHELFRAPYRRLNTWQYIFAVIYLFLLGMHLLVKAPRGLMLIYGLLYGLTYLVLHRIIPKRWVVGLILLSGVAYQIFKLYQEVYAYSGTRYPQVVSYLQAHDIHQVATTVGLNLLPYALPEGIEVKAVNNEEELARLKSQGYTHVLLDNYYRAANVLEFPTLETTRPEMAWPEPALVSPLLYLDHAEFNGLSYRQVLANQQTARREPRQIRLLRIP
jgi:hypothetical protein